MAIREEMRDALDDYVAQAGKSERVLKAMSTWNCIIYIEATDIDTAFTIAIQGGQTTLYEGQYEQPDLIVRGSCEDLTNIFWGDANPASNYMQGAIKVQGSQDDVMRLDAMATMIYLGG